MVRSLHLTCSQEIVGLITPYSHCLSNLTTSLLNATTGQLLRATINAVYDSETHMYMYIFANSVLPL